MNTTGARQKVVIVGGGFAGIETARLLAKKQLPLDITLISNNPDFQYYPNLYRLVVGASVSQASVPLTSILPSTVTLVIDTYTGVTPAEHTITLQSGATVAYDFLVMALGSEPNYFGIAGLETHSKSFLSVEKALALKNYYADLIIACRTLPEAEARKRLHTIIVGAGPAGVELAGVLRSYLIEQARVDGLNPALVTVDLLDSSPRVLSSLPARASALVKKQLQKKGVTFYGHHGVSVCDEHAVTIIDTTTATETKKKMSVGTIIWTAGTKINTAFAAIPQVEMTERKRVVVTPTLTLSHDDKIYIAGDGSGTPFSGLAQTAIDQGSYIAKAIAYRVQNKLIEPYQPKQGVFVIPVGKYWAILNYKDLVISGWPAYLLRIMVDIRYFFSITSLAHIVTMMRKK
jgi:NADH dehydrogenase